MNFGDIAKNIGKEFLNKYLKKIKIIAVLIVVGMVMLVAIIGAGDASNNSTNEAEYGSPTGWWWPIGSAGTTTEGGKLFASGEPELGARNVSCVGKNGGSKWGITAGAHSHSSNIGLDVGAGGETNKYYVVSVGKGTVIGAADTVAENEYGDTGGMGNYVIVDYGEMIVRYMHLYHGSVTVKIGDTVDYGQVLGKIGLNGDTTGAHSHTDYQDKNKNWLDPVDIVNPNNPRPMSVGSYNNVNTELIDYLLFFGGDTTRYTIDGKEYYKSYDDTAGLLTVGRDVYISGAKNAFSVPGYVSDTKKGPSKKVNNVYEYAINKFNSGTCIYIECDLCNKTSSKLVESKMGYVDALESKTGDKFSMQQRYALCAIYYRRLFYRR